MPDFAAAYAQAHERLVPLLRSAGDAVASKAVVPACPLWTLKDLVAHLPDVSHSYAAGRHVYPVESRDGVEIANLEGHVDELDAWTQEGVDARRGNSLDELLEDWDRGSEALCRTMRGDV